MAKCWLHPNENKQGCINPEVICSGVEIPFWLYDYCLPLKQNERPPHKPKRNVLDLICGDWSK